MRLRLLAAGIAALVSFVEPLTAQEHPVRRVADIVSVAVEEYARGIDSQGRLISQLEYEEATTFLAEARLHAARLPGPRAAAALAILDSIVAAVGRKEAPADVKAMQERFATALGSEAALELPQKSIDLAEGKQLYERNC